MGREWQSLRLAQAIAGSERFNASPECLLSSSGLLHGKSMAGIESCHVQNCCAHVSLKALGQLAHNEGTQTMQASKSQHGPWLFLRVFSTIYCCRRSIYIIWCHPVVSHRQRLRIARHSRATTLNPLLRRAEHLRNQLNFVESWLTETTGPPRECLGYIWIP